MTEETPHEVTRRQRQFEGRSLPDGGLTSAGTTLTVAYRGAPLLSGYLPNLAVQARLGDGEIFPPFQYQDPIDPEDPEAPRAIRRAVLVIKHLDARPTEEELRRRSEPGCPCGDHD